jgi:mannose-1-phosphate guanylyltransferase
MLADGGFYWNSGIFMFTAGKLMEEMEAHAPEVAEAAREAVANAVTDLDFIRLDAAAFIRSPDISIDYAVMEKTSNAAVVPSSFTWSDLGSWDAVWKLGTRDEAGNMVSGNATLMDTRDSLVMSRTSHLAVQGLENVVVIASEDAVYVGRLEESQNVGRMVKKLAADKATSPLTETHPTSYRPWGGYTSILNGDRFQVKRLFVSPGKKLSLQKHHHRSEHWICVKGTAEVTVGDEVKTVRGERKRLHPAGRGPSSRQPGQDPARDDRGADRFLSRRGRHHPHRRRVWPRLRPARSQGGLALRAPAAKERTPNACSSGHFRPRSGPFWHQSGH